MDKINVLYDWLSFSDHSEGFDVYAACALLGIPFETFRLMPHGNRGYRQAIMIEGIWINFDHPLHLGCWIEMSGSACRAFESLSQHGSFDFLFDHILKYNCNLNRLDVAVDEFLGILDMNVLCSDTRLQNYVSPSRSWKVTESSEGQNIDIGSAQSNVLIRIYDKAAERKKEGHWIRVELQLKEERALGFIMNKNPLNEKIPGVLLNYLRYVSPGTDSNKSRWQTRQYWTEFLQTTQKIAILIKGGKEYNLSDTKNYVYKLAGNCVFTLVKCYGLERFFTELCLNKPPISRKYLDLIDEYISSKGGKIDKIGADSID